ncbi:MAG: hypothetical protein GXO35_07905 [Gammaproteobacteria bacterium]|nr:hypothetical protein [Gammaproteobacteria bacterium]
MISLQKKSLLILLAAPLISSVSLAADSVKLTTGFFSSDGQSDIVNIPNSSTQSIPLMLSVRKGKLSLGLSTGYVSIKSGTLNEAGMGDTTLSLGYTLSDTFSVKIKEKFATGDAAKNLSTGKEDTSVQLDYFGQVNQSQSLFATAGYKFTGKVAGANMQDASYASVGTGYMLASKISIGASLDFRESSYKTVDSKLGITAFASKPLSKTYSLAGFAGYDNTQTSSLGVSLTTKF